MNAMTMGSVYMDKGEGLDYLTEQVMRMVKMKPSMYFLDIICTADQVFEATTLLDSFYKLTGELMPDLPYESTFAAITCNEKIRPAAMALALMTSIDGDQIAMLDVNPDRKGR